MKKTDFIGIRCTPELKEELQKIADKNRWTLSQTAAIILEEYILEKKKEKQENEKN